MQYWLKKGFAIMFTLRRLASFVSVSIVCICACKAGTQAPTSLTTINGQQGGRIVYSSVSGAATQPAAMAKMLNTVQNNCGEKPQIGNVIQFKGTNSVGVFFTVIDHPEGNMPLDGLVIATATGPNQVETAMIYDQAARFSKTANPLLQQLFSVWHPGSQAAASSSAVGGNSASGGKGTASAAPLQKVTLPDNTASVGVPAGWKVDPGCAGGTISLTGPHGEVIDLSLGLTAVDPTNRFVQQSQRSGSRNAFQGKFISYPSNVDLAKAFPEIFDQIRRMAGAPGSANIQITHAEQIPAQQGQRCVHISGHSNPNGQGSNEIDSLLCATPPGPDGMYGFTLFHSAIPVAYADQERATALAIIASFQQNKTLLQAKVTAATAPVIAAMNKQIESQAAQAINNIHQIGANTTARINESEKEHDAQNSAWDASQVNNARNGQGFNNYILDQSVVEDNNKGGNGTVGHSTVSNSLAQALVKANPNRFSTVDTPNYWQGTDFHP